MSSLQDEVRRLVDRDAVVARADHPSLVGAIGRMVRAGELVAVVPGVYSSRARAPERLVRATALVVRQPDAVLAGPTAAQLGFWPGLRGETVTYALAHKWRAPPGFSGSRRTVPPELVVQRDRFRLTCPALTALDLCDDLGGDGIDQALRTRTATLPGLHHALELTGGRRGNGVRRALLLDSRDEPWSAAERVCHRLLRSAGIVGWKANLPVLVSGRRRYLDVGFRHLHVAIEIDGRLHERDEHVFEDDRWRQNALVLDGWLVLRFTWRMLVEQPDEVLETIRQALAIRGAEF
ncbi:DUF559 domain-containing protein [Microlunatus flavus]|uniref:Very-short-patch-repair endonuclease n=1 Tax=Microlunatus flavus TaxID=1036181 RepID=A0A1H9AM97_9ACTN|nr:DUF559 domain-containing protein [Microlunatus flavus]SEP77840.1 Very-short-patch-repair endonuclease [Microlunatus flavus]